MNLVAKIDKFEKEGKERRGGGCVFKALDLKTEHDDQGQPFWVGKVLNSLGTPVKIAHCYYIPPNATDDSYALNHADNGFAQYPQFTVGELRAMGRGEIQNILDP